MAAITNYPKVISLASTDIVTIHDASSRRTKRTDIVQICKYARDYIKLGEDAEMTDYLQELMQLLTIVDGNLIATSTDSFLGDDSLATTSAVRSLITETTSDLASAQDISTLRANLTAYVDGSIVSFTTADAVSQLITKAGVGYSTAADLTTLQTTMQGYTNGQLASYTTTTAMQELITTSTRDLASAASVTTLETDLKSYADGVVTGYSNTEAVEGLIATATTDQASAEAFTTLQSELGTFNADGNLTSISSSFADNILSTANTATFAAAEDLTTLKSEFGTFDDEGELITLSSSFVSKVLSTENTAQFAAASEIDTLQAQFTDEDGNTLISRIDENKQVIAGVDGKTEAVYTLEVDDGTGNIAGMKLGSSDAGSEIRFTADSFKISNGTEGETPFEVVDGSVKIKSASISSITLGDLQGPKGDPGQDGDPGAAKYTWVKYADSLEYPRGLSDWHVDKKYVGMAFNKDTANESSNWEDYKWSLIGGEDGLPGDVGEAGRRTARGVIFYQSGSATSPSQIYNDNIAYDFNEGVFINLPENWGVDTPEMAAGTASNNYWTSSYYVTENEVHKQSDVMDWYKGNGAIVVEVEGEPRVYKIKRTIADASPYIATHAVLGNDGTYWGNSGTVSVWARGSGTLRLRLQEYGSDYTPYEGLEITLTDTLVKYSVTGVNIDDGSTPQVVLTLLEGEEVDIYNPLLIADDSGVGRVTFQTPVRSFAFNQVVTFNSLSSSGSTIINGNNITTGKIDASTVNVTNINANNITAGTIDASTVTVKNINANKITTGTIDASNINVSNINANNIKTGTISADRISTSIARSSEIPDTSDYITQGTDISGNQISTGILKSGDYDNTSGNGFSEAGMAIDLDNDSIHTPQFSIGSDGSANFKGTIELLNTKPNVDYTLDQSILIEPGNGNIKLAFDNMPSADLELQWADAGFPEEGELILDSLGLSINTAGILSMGGDWGFYKSLDGTSNNGILADVRALKVDNTSLNFEGQRWITGAYFKATNEAVGYGSYQTPTATYGAVIERARLDGVIPQALTISAGTTSSNPRLIPSIYACYINKNTNSGTSYVKLPNDARKYQQIDITTLHNNHSTRVYSGCTPGLQNRPGEHGDHRSYDANADKIYYSSWISYVDVDQRQTERFVWMGTYWKLIRWDQ
tara:strand:+ start:553 stop:4032 length:3480 start_codon:yes stop_codon:yes gene_type:complete